MLDVLSLAEQDTSLKKASTKEQSGPCPNPSCRCQTNGFRVRWDGTQWRFMCRGCWDSQEILTTGKRAGQRRGWGDAINYLRHYKGKSFTEAEAMVKSETDSAPIRAPVLTPGNTSTDWQEKTAKWVKECEDRLQSPRGIKAWAYVNIKRGLKDEIIKGAHMGYDIQDGIPRLIIPVFNRGRYVAVYRRDLRPDAPKDQRWKDAPGSAKNELYAMDSLTLRKNFPVVLCEDALSALSIIQECPDLVNAVATGGVDACQNMAMVAKLAVAPLVLVAFDADEAGDSHAHYWLKRLKNARRLRPMLKDVNDMLTGGWDIRRWVEDALKPVEQESEPPVETQDVPTDACELVCSKCQSVSDLDLDTPPFEYDDEGVCFCPACWTQRNTISEDVQPPSMETSAHFLETVQQVAASQLPGWRVELLPKDYTIAQCIEDQRDEAHERDLAMWQAIRARAARPKSLAWSQAQVRQRVEVIEPEEDYTDIEPDEDALPSDMEMLTALEQKWRSDSIETPFWRAICGYEPGAITRRECLRRLQEALASPNPSYQFEARADLHSRLLVKVPGLRHQLYRIS